MSDAVLQFQFDRPRVGKYGYTHGYDKRTAQNNALEIAQSALWDVWVNGGTLVVSAHSKTVTIIQRTVAEDFSEKSK